MMILIKRRKERTFTKQSRDSGMSSKTRDFIQKICYRRTASVDVTHYGFICDSKVNRVNVQLRPLQEQLDKICGKTDNNSKYTAPARDTTTYISCKKWNKNSKDKKDRKKKQKHSTKTVRKM